MLECVSAGERKGKWTDHSHHLRLRINFGTLFLLNNFPLSELRSSGLWADLPTEQVFFVHQES